MEERFHPPSPPPFPAPPTHDNQQTSIPQPSHHRLYRIDEDNVALQFILPSPSKNHNDTYIVEMTKDRIYRVPPPENAVAIERQRQPTQSTWRRCTPCAWYGVCSVAMFAILTVVFYVIYKFTLTPHNPIFVIMSFSVKEQPNPNSSSHHALPMYHVGIQVTNPNNANSLAYLASTNELQLDNNEVARGPTPTITQVAKEIDDFEVVLIGRTGEVPKAIQQAVNPNPDDKNAGRSGVKLTLTMSFAMRKETWLMTKRDLVIIKCEFVVERVAQGSTTIKSQTCDYI